MITIEHTTLKRKMLEACIMKQEALIDDFKIRTRNLLDTAGLGNEEAYDNQEISQKSQESVELSSLCENLNLAEEEMKILENLKASGLNEQSSATLGAVVVTNREAFFVCVSTEQFDVDGKTFIGLSVKSPLFVAMKGKTKGDNFSCRGITHKILEIF